MQGSFAFITYTRKDAGLAREVCDHLTTQGLSVWQGENRDPEGAFLSRMDKDIIKNINCLIILITSSICNPDWQSPWARDDTNLARREGICLLPVIGDQTLKGLWRELPKSLTNQLYIEWYVEEDRARLTSHLQPCQVSRVPIMMPAKPANFVQRDTAFTVVKKALLRTGTESDPAPLSAALLGTGGFGKTCLATAICHDSEIQDRFHDGILWVTVGKEPKGLPPDSFLLSKVQELIQNLGSNTTETATLETVVVLLEQLLDKKDVLLVVDDVWTSRDLTHFLKGGRGTVGRLITTRNKQVLDTPDIKVDEIQKVELMQENEAIQLLAPASSNDPQVTEQLKRLARQCDYWPPLLVQASDWLEMADSEENIVQHRKKLAASILDPSMEFLSNREYRAFRDLAISFPAGPIPLADVYSLWWDHWQLKKVEGGDLLFKLLDHSLLQHLNVGSAVVQLHDVVRTHLRSTLHRFPNVLIDMEGFSQWEEAAQQRAVLQRFDRVLEEGLKPFIGFVKPRQAVGWHGTGDGYYITMQNFPPAVAMRFAVDLEKSLARDNRLHPDFPLRLRIGLCLEDVEWVGRQQLSQAYTEAARLVDHPWTRELLKRRTEQATVLVASALFMDEWQAHSDEYEETLSIPPSPPWVRAEFSIKHDKILVGYMRVEREQLDAIMVRMRPVSPVVTPPLGVISTVDFSPWLRRMLDETQFIKIGGMGTGRGIGKEARPFYLIEDLYTVLRSRGMASKTEGMAGGEGDGTLAAWLPGHARLLIEGQAGAGKSTFLNLIFTMLARDHLQEGKAPGGLPWRSFYLGLPDEEGVRLPLLIRLSWLVDRLTGSNRKDGGILLDWLVADLPEAETTEQKGVWRRAWEAKLVAGEVMLLLDGLDEVANEGHRDHLRLVLMDIDKRWGKCPMVVASRPYQTEFLRDLAFKPVMIEPFRSYEIRAFLDRWVAVLSGRSVGRQPQGEPDSLRRKLEQAIVQRREIRRMAANPVMLTCLCVVHWNEGAMPGGRSRVYQAVTNWLRRAREGLRTEHGFTDRFSETAFLQLALAMMGASGTGKRATWGKRDAARAIDSVMARNFPDLSLEDRLLKATEWLNFELIWSGIIEEVGQGKLRFWYLTFQEYLAARQLSLLPGTDDGPGWWAVVRTHLSDPQWWETVALLPGCLLDANGEQAVDDLLRRVLDSRSLDQPELIEDARIAGSMARMLEPMSVYHYRPPKPIEAAFQAVLARVMTVFTREGARQVPIAIRMEAANALGQAGDPRLRRVEWIEVHGTGGWLLGKYLVTVAEYQLFVEAEGYQDQRWWCATGWAIRLKANWENPDGWDNQTLHPNHPVIGISWFEAMAYCRWLSEREKRLIRLPFETLWEKAAGQGTYPWGEAAPTPELANFDGNVGAPTPVGLYPAGNGPQDHCDLAGNVMEWQRNLYGDRSVEDTPLDPTVTLGDIMVLRGGAWRFPVGNLRSAFRYENGPERRNSNIGFRLAAVPLPTLEERGEREKKENRHDRHLLPAPQPWQPLSPTHDEPLIHRAVLVLPDSSGLPGWQNMLQADFDQFVVRDPISERPLQWHLSDLPDNEPARRTALASADLAFIYLTPNDDRCLADLAYRDLVRGETIIVLDPSFPTDALPPRSEGSVVTWPTGTGPGLVPELSGQNINKLLFDNQSDGYPLRRDAFPYEHWKEWESSRPWGLFRVACRPMKGNFYQEKELESEPLLVAANQLFQDLFALSPNELLAGVPLSNLWERLLQQPGIDSHLCPSFVNDQNDAWRRLVLSDGVFRSGTPWPSRIGVPLQMDLIARHIPAYRQKVHHNLYFACALVEKQQTGQKVRQRVFISYSRKSLLSVEFSEILKNFFAKEKIITFDGGYFLPGDKIEDRIYSEIDNCSVAIILLSQESLSSEWVRRQTLAFMKRQQFVRIIPVLMGVREMDGLDIFIKETGLDKFKFISLKQGNKDSLEKLALNLVREFSWPMEELTGSGDE